METKLLPCPLCGGEVSYAAVDGWFTIGCRTCALSVGYGKWDWEQRAEASAAWNTRTPSPLRTAADLMETALETMQTTMICQNYKKHVQMVEAALAAYRAAKEQP
jgi:Restriction alleviation protein Lar